MEKQWWHDAVVYQIYPRSFKDSNNDGIGDLNGIIEKLDYLQTLGVDILWLSPVYKSPMDDNGYDISDYQDIAPEFGTMADMERLIAEADKRGMKLMMDLVVNHTSDEHPWFQSAVASKDSPYRDYYIFRPPTFEIQSPEDIEKAVPSDIGSVFSGSAWTYSEATGEYYFHLFSKRQPDLNWENPKVADEVHRMMNWWLDKGIGGFRMDVIDLIGKEIDNKITGNGPRLHNMLKAMNKATFGSKDVVTVGETWGATPEIAKLYSNPEREELSMVFQFEHVTAFHDEKFGKWRPKPVDFAILKNTLTKWQTELADEGWNSLFWNNHDLPRVVSKYGDTSSETNRVLSAKMLATMIHCMKGTPYIYQGEELGMTNVHFETLEQYKDIETLNAYKAHVPKDINHESMMDAIWREGRDNARTPMQWSAETGGGFTGGTPWIALNPNYETINADSCLNDPNSIFSYYRQLIQLRKNEPAIIYGDFEVINANHPSLYAYKRRYRGTELLVLINHTAALLALPEGILSSDNHYLPLIFNYTVSTDANCTVHNTSALRPYEALVLKLQNL